MLEKTNGVYRRHADVAVVLVLRGFEACAKTVIGEGFARQMSLVQTTTRKTAESLLL